MCATYLFVILEAVLILVRFLASNDRAAERLNLFGRERYLLEVSASQLLMRELPQHFGIIDGQAKILVGSLHLQLLLCDGVRTLLAEQALTGLVNRASTVMYR